MGLQIYKKNNITSSMVENALARRSRFNENLKPKIEPRSAPIFYIFFNKFLTKFLINFGTMLGPILGPDLPKRDQDEPKSCLLYTSDAADE